MAYIRKQILTIANGQTTSDAFDAGEMGIMGIQFPAAFTGASITFTVSTDDSVYQELNEVSDDAVGTAGPTKVLVTQGKSYTLPDALTPWRYFKIVSASAEGGARSLVVTAKAP